MIIVKNMKNYISVTAGKDAEEVKSIISEFQKAGYSINQNYAPVIGIQISENTLRGIRPKNLRLASFNDIPSLLQLIDGNLIPVIHYNTKNLNSLFEQVSKVLDTTYEYCKLIQINAKFPGISELSKIKERYNELKISLQVDYTGLDIKETTEKIISYGDSLDYILIDPSRGRGDRFNISDTSILYLEIKDKKPEYNIVIAGGIDGDNANEVLTNLIDLIQTKNFSICAEGKLRDKVSDEYWGMDILNIEKVRKYLLAVKKILNPSNPV